MRRPEELATAERGWVRGGLRWSKGSEAGETNEVRSSFNGSGSRLVKVSPGWSMWGVKVRLSRLGLGKGPERDGRSYVYRSIE